ncbi:MAG: hypothetical protein BHW41_02115 [Oscillibacter sp. 57_20]|nr:MAG: hypothetical protein BHW41_02115 [Oscillibacter sp. 57_20]
MQGSFEWFSLKGRTQNVRRIAAGDVLHIFFASRKGTVPVRMRPPLFFCLVKRKVAATAVEKETA